MAEHILFLTGKLAEKQLRRTLSEMSPDFEYTVHVLGVTVAALMTADMIQRRLTDTFGADRILVPGRCRGDLDALSQHFGIPVERGPEELNDLPEFFGKARQRPDLSRYELRIFGEVVEAPHIDVAAIIRRAEAYRRDGADVIDLGCLPSTPFPHLADAIKALKSEGFLVSIDSLDPENLLLAGRAGADFLLSLNEETLWIADEVASTPVLISTPHADMDSLDRVIAKMQNKGRPFIVDPILDPIHFGFTDSIIRYHELRRRHPDVEIMMGVGNLTELTHIDTAGMNGMLLGICSELHVRHILATQVSKHACKAIKEADLIRRIMLAARESNRLPKHIDDGLMALHERAPFPLSFAEIQELQTAIRDPSFRIMISTDGVHIFNRNGLWTDSDPFALFPHLGVENDGGHAFYLGVELARAQIAQELDKRYTQDQPLNWGIHAQFPEATAGDLNEYAAEESTLKASREASPCPVPSKDDKEASRSSPCPVPSNGDKASHASPCPVPSKKDKTS